MEIKKEMPEEVKNQIIDGKKRVVTEKIPEKFVKKITEKLALKRKRIQTFVQVSFTVAQAQKKQQEGLDLLNSVGDSITDAINQAFKRMKLGKQKDRRWRFDGKDSFIGVYNPPKPKLQPGKKVDGSDYKTKK